MATGENFKRIAHQISEANKPKLKVSKKEEQRIQSEIKKLQDQRTEYYNNDNITDEELKQLEKEINNKINKLIESMY